MKRLAAFVLLLAGIGSAYAGDGDAERLRAWRAGEKVSEEAVAEYGIDRCFASSEIGDALFARMYGKSYKPDCTVPRSDLRYLRVLHRNLAGETLLGELVCNEAISGDLLEIFRMLYDAGTTEAAIGQMLEVVGRAYDVSRVYIFENSADDTLCYNTFEWCGEGVSSERENLQGLSYQEDLGDYQSNFDANGIFYCRDISTLHPDLYAVLAPQGICSMLQCAILDDGRFKGYVGFDECRANRYWTQEQIESLTLVARVLSTFLVKQRLREHVQALEQRLAQEKEQ